MSALTQHTMRTPTLQPVPESLPVTTDHVPSVPKSAVKSKVGMKPGQSHHLVDTPYNYSVHIIVREPI